MNIKYLTDSFLFFWDKIEKRENFSLLRYADGEKAVASGMPIRNIDGWEAPDGITPLGKAISAAMQFDHPMVWHGISCPCCGLGVFYWYREHIKSSNLTFSNIWVNANYKMFKKRFDALDRDAVLIANHMAKGKKIANLNILKHYEIGDNPFTFFEKKFESLVDQIEQDFGHKENLLYVVSAGPLSEPLIIELFKRNPNNTYIDFGSVIDIYYKDGFSRNYMNPNHPDSDKNCYMHTENADVSVILSAYKKTGNLPLQIEAIKKQSLKPKEILLFQDGIDDGPSVTIPNEVLDQLDGVEISPVNVGVWARFKFAQKAKYPFVCVFDDDTIPGEDWLANCHNNFMQAEGIYGTVGVLMLPYCNYPPENNLRMGWNYNLSNRVEVDFVGHSWFLKKEWLEYMFDCPEELKQYKLVGEDMALSYCASLRGIRTYVPPHPRGRLNLFGSIPSYAWQLGAVPQGIAGHPENMRAMNKAFLALKDKWNFTYLRRPEYVRDIYKTSKEGGRL